MSVCARRKETLLLVRSAGMSARGRSFLERRVLPTLQTALRSPRTPAPAPGGDQPSVGVGVGKLGMALVAVMCSAHATLLEPLASALVEGLANVHKMHSNGAYLLHSTLIITSHKVMTHEYYSYL